MDVVRAYTGAACGSQHSNHMICQTVQIITHVFNSTTTQHHYTAPAEMERYQFMVSPVQAAGDGCGYKLHGSSYQSVVKSVRLMVGTGFSLILIKTLSPWCSSCRALPSKHTQALTRAVSGTRSSISAQHRAQHTTAQHSIARGSSQTVAWMWSGADGMQALPTPSLFQSCACHHNTCTGHMHIQKPNTKDGLVEAHSTLHRNLVKCPSTYTGCQLALPV